MYFVIAHVKVKTAGDGYVDHRASRKSGNVDIHVRPEQRMQRRAPPFRLAEKLLQTFLLDGGIAPARTVSIRTCTRSAME